MESGFGPDGAPGAVVLTFDNLGEASALERGEWPPGAPLGTHESVTIALPWLLDELDAHGLRATFFVEAINCEINPDAVREIDRRGHELGMHAWRHESWGELAPQHETELLTRGVEAFARLETTARGFRPPGGRLLASSPAALTAHGFDWCSPEGTVFERRDGLTYVPFEWEHVDAYHLTARFDALLPHDEVEARLTAAIARPGAMTLILHPFLMLEDAWRAAVARILARIGEQVRGGTSWVVPGGVYADWLTR